MFMNLDGIIGRIFKIGYGASSATIKYNDNGDIELDKNLDLGDHQLKMSSAAAGESGLVSGEMLEQVRSDTVNACNDYTDRKISEVQPGGGGDIDKLSVHINISDMKEGYQAIIGTAKANSFLYQIIFEVQENFVKADDSDWYISIGTLANHDLIVPNFKMSEKLQTTFILDVCKSIDADTELMLFITEVHEEQPFEEDIVNPHSDVVYSLTSDASHKVWQVNLTGENVYPSIYIFPDVDGHVDAHQTADFGIRLPPNMELIIKEENQALSLIDSALYDDLGIEKDINGIWRRESNITTGETTSYKFIMDQMLSNNDYRHIYVYDANGDPDEAILSFHIKNELDYGVETSTPVSYIFMGNSEAAISCEREDFDGSVEGYTMAADGTVTFSEEDEDRVLVTDGTYFTKLLIYYPYAISDEGIHVIMTNPIFADFVDQSDIEHVDDDYIRTVDITADDNGRTGIWFSLMLKHSDAPTTLTVSNPLLEKPFLVTVETTDLYVEPKEVEEDPAAVNPVLYNTRNLIAMASNTVAVGSEGTTDSGKARVLTLIL